MLMKVSVNPVQCDNLKGMTVFNTEEVDTTKQPMFFGKPLGIQGKTKLNNLLEELSNAEESECESCAI